MELSLGYGMKYVTEFILLGQATEIRSRVISRLVCAILPTWRNARLKPYARYYPPLPYSSPDINAILTNLKHYYKNAIKWFGDNSMKANPDKFQFMVLSSDPLEQQKIEIENDITLLSEPRVKLLGVIIDKYSLLMHCIKIKSRAKSLLNEQYVFVGGTIYFLWTCYHVFPKRHSQLDYELNDL